MGSGPQPHRIGAMHRRQRLDIWERLIGAHPGLFCWELYPLYLNDPAGQRRPVADPYNDLKHLERDGRCRVEIGERKRRYYYPTQTAVLAKER